MTILALCIADGLHENIPDIHFDRDVIIAGGLVHDIGKTYEYDPERAMRWRSQPQQVGYPPVRHPAYGVYLAMRAGLPESVVQYLRDPC